MSTAEVAKFLTPDSFGRGTFLGGDPSILDLAPPDRLTVSAWRHACPRPGMVIDYYGQTWLKKQNNPESISPEEVRRHGIEMTRQRYDECNFVFGLIKDQVAKKGASKSNLLKLLTNPTSRLPEEPVGIYELGRIPESHQLESSPLSTLVGYALPRVFIEQAGRNRVFIEQAGRDNEKNWKRYSLAIDLLDEAIDKSESPAELLAIFAQLVTQADAKPTAVLSHVLEPGILLEENNLTEYGQVIAALKSCAPTLWAHYLSLSETDREEAGILNL